MLRSRYFWFLVVILIGAAGGLYYGWAVKPLQPRTSMDLLRTDYKTDMVLMVAEVYRMEKNPSLAASRLTILGDQAPLRMVQEAILSAGEIQYSNADVDLLVQLADALSKLPAAAGLP